uniref:Secreted protein n=1 Tax=Labrus bergylta TaxID=56723 RepID=A0A3Q3FX91_9LABR
MNSCVFLSLLLLAVPEIALALQPLELAEGGGGVLVEAVGDGLGLLRLADQDGVTPEDHGHVLDLVPVDPRQDLRPARVGDSRAAGQGRSAAARRGWTGRSAPCPGSWVCSWPHPPPEQTYSVSRAAWCS